jgi:hypothetical protein
MKLKSLLILAAAVLSTSAFAGVAAKAPAVIQPVAEEPLGFTATIGYDTHYVFRGVLFAENLVSAGIDGIIPLTDMLSLNVGAWYGTSADDSGVFGAGGSFHELDLYAALLVKVGDATVGLKFTEYLYDGTAAVDDIPEVGIIATVPLGFVDLTAGVYYDFTADGVYGEIGISKSIPITDTISLVPGVLVSAAEDYYGVSGFNHIKVGLSLPIKLTSTATLTPYVAGNFPLGDLDDLGEDSRVYGGIALSVAF